MDKELLESAFFEFVFVSFLKSRFRAGTRKCYDYHGTKASDIPMKILDKKPWLFKAIALGLLGLVFFFNLGTLMLPLTGTRSAYSLWSIPFATMSGLENEKIFALILDIAFFLYLLPLGFSIAGLIKKKKTPFFITIAYGICLSLAFFAYNALFKELSSGAITLVVFALLFVLGAFALLVLDKKPVNEAAPLSEENAAKAKPLAIGGLLVDLIATLTLLITMLAVPLYEFHGSVNTNVCILFNVLAGKSTQAEDSIYLLVQVLLFILCLLYLLSSLSYFFSDKKRFMANSKVLILLEFGVALEFFLMGFIIDYVYALKNYEVRSTAFVPLLLMAVAEIAFAILKGRFDYYAGPEEERIRKKKDLHSPQRIELFIYVLVVTAITIGSLFLNVINVSFVSGGYKSEVKLTGIELLQKYGQLGSGYQVIAFALVVMLISTGIALLVSLTSFITRDRRYVAVAKAAILVNIAFMFIFGISGYYFSIATQINVENTKKLLTLYGYTYNESIEYSMRTDVVYMLYIDVVLLIVMIARKAFKEEPLIVEGGEAAVAVPPEEKKENPKPEDKKEEIPCNTPVVFDPCPAFSALDSEKETFQKDLDERKKIAVKDTSLNDLVKFVVEYAKDSRLHLSYSAQDIAAFVAGLGAARLTILQGMSGTGKTSLPKIFMEAIDGDCDLVEVESSWKDKNELLGYYNEFSERYSPKKFTQALYKAALNPEIPTFIVLDEMNLSRIEYYFSDFLSLMENEEGKRQIQLLNIPLIQKTPEGDKPYSLLADGKTLMIPSNIWFVGTANRDESTFVISDKVYDRAHTMNFNHRAPKVRDASSNPIPQRFYTYAQLNALFEEAKSQGHFDAENNVLIQKTEALLSPYNISFGNRILKQIEDFVVIYEACFAGSPVEDEAIETILLSKVVSKLEVKTIDNKEELVESFQNLHLNKCAEFVSKLNED